MVDYFVKDWTLRELMNDGYDYPVKIYSGHYMLNTLFSDLSNGFLICERYKNRGTNHEFG